MFKVLHIVSVVIVFIFYWLGVRSILLKYKVPEKLCRFVDKWKESKHGELVAWLFMATLLSLFFAAPILIFIMTMTCGH